MEPEDESLMKLSSGILFIIKLFYVIYLMLSNLADISGRHSSLSGRSSSSLSIKSPNGTICFIID